MSSPVFEQLRRCVSEVEAALSRGQCVQMTWNVGKVETGRDTENWPLYRLDGSASFTVTISPSEILERVGPS